MVMQAGDVAVRQEVQALYANHHRWLYGWLLRRLRCTERAADLMQDTFVRVLVRTEPPGVQQPRAFLATVARRVLSNHHRRARIEQAYLDALAALPEPVAPSPEARAIVIETLVEIDQMLDGLGAPVRQAFLRAQLDGLGHAEIAAELGVSVSTVKRYIVKAAERCYFAL